MRTYLVTNTVNGKQYVGQTIRSIATRWKAHVYDAGTRRYRSLLHSAIRKYGVFAFTVVPLSEEADTESLNQAERHYIAELNTKAPLGYNLTDGGEGTLNPAPVSRRRMRRAKLGIKRPAHIGQAHSLRMKGRKNTPEHRRNIALANIGQKRSAAARKSMSLAHAGKPWTATRREAFEKKKREQA